MNAVIETGGKQYKIGEGDTIFVEKLDVNVGDTVTLDRVLLVNDDGKVTIGNPLVDNAKVIAKVEQHVKSKKIIVFKYKAKKNYRKKTGHRQPYTKLKIDKIEA